MKLMKQYLTALIYLIFVAGITACEKISDPELATLLSTLDTESGKQESDGLKIIGTRFSDNYKHILLDVDVSPDLNSRIRQDSDKVAIKIRETVNNIKWAYETPRQPVLTRVQNVVAEETEKQNLRILAVVDLTLDQQTVDQQQAALSEIRNVYSSDKVYVSFMYDNRSTEPLPLTGYVLDNYFVSKENSTKYLYRTIVEKRDEMISPESGFPATDNMALLLFSDGKTYGDDNYPLDPKHYAYKAELDKIYPTLIRDTLSIYYVNMSQESAPDRDETNTMLRRLCKNYDGLYQNRFDWPALEEDFKRAFGLTYCDYTLQLTNPDGKIYRGYPHVIDLSYVDQSTGETLASAHTSYTLGNVYEPLIINGKNLVQIIVQGLFITLLLSLLVYLVLQYIVPAVSYWLFKRKYVVPYKGPGMVINEQLVGDTCYLCKDKFREDDRIVTKCAHTMHFSCWQENEYHCPEYGRRCRQGSHYYNTRRLWDLRNALPLMYWFLIGLATAFIAWLFFLYDVRLFNPGQFTASIQGNSAGEISALTSFGFCVSLCIILIFGLASINRRTSMLRALSLLLYALGGALCCSIFFFLECYLVQLLDIASYSYLVDWIPWVLSNILIVYLLNLYMHRSINKRVILISCALSMLSMTIWNFFFVEPLIDYRLLLLCSFILYTLSVALSIAPSTHRSEHYVLSLTGNIKPVDVALYKWFRTSPSEEVTIGRSVNCHLQITWDTTGTISPVQAKIILKNGILRMYALEEGVTVRNKPWPLNKGLRLYHGTRFTIGTTTFTYKEKDYTRTY